jgi:hypothetical protein
MPAGYTPLYFASAILPDGRMIVEGGEQPCQTCLTNPDLTVDDALLNAKTLRWTVIPATGKDDPNDEEGWTLEPNGQLLALDLWAPGETQVYNPRTQSWSFAGGTAANGSPLDPWPVVEIGPQAEMPGGNTFVVGAGSSTQEAQPDGGLHGRRDAEPVMGALDHSAEPQDTGPWAFLQPVRQAARRAGPGTRLW